MNNYGVNEYLNFDIGKSPFWRIGQIDVDSMLQDIFHFVAWYRFLPNDYRKEIINLGIIEDFKIHFVRRMATEENEGVQTEGETRKIHQALAGSNQTLQLTEPMKLTANMFDTLNLACDQAQEVEKMEEAYFITVDTLNEWHRELWKGIASGSTSKPGEPRSSSGIQVVTYDGARVHTYPSSLDVPGALQRFVDIFCSIADDMHRKRSALDIENVSLTMKWAAWSMFVFVSLHPYLDGNGRLSRIISNYVLSSMLPMAVAVFNVFSPTQRGDYIEALIVSRGCPCQAGEPCYTFDQMIRQAKPSLVATMVLECCWYFCREFRLGEKLSSILIDSPLPWPETSPGKMKDRCAGQDNINTEQAKLSEKRRLF